MNEHSHMSAEALKRIAECGRRRGAVLDLSRLGLTHLPETLFQLAKLTDLNLSQNSLATLPPEIGHLDHLTRLNLSHNTLTNLPPEIGQPANLTLLDLSYNKLDTLPAELGNLSNLTRLDLSHNPLASLPPTIGHLTKLTRLYLADNHLNELPSEISQLANLTRLYLTNNRLTTLPPEIGQLENLTRLDLSNNLLASLPPEIGLLAKLTVLDLSNNRIAGLPPEVGQLSKLTVLSLMSNRLAVLTDGLRGVETLETLLLHDNPDLQLSPSVLGADPRSSPQEGLQAPRPPSAKAILDFYFARKNGKNRPLNEVKIVLLGRSGAGKTSIVQALRDLPFREREESTRGIVLSDLLLDGSDGLPVTAHVWDFSGQEITHALHPFFFSVRSLVVVVLTGRENHERDDADYWLRMIQTIGGDNHGHGPPVIVALNQWNVAGGRADVDRAALRKLYPFIRGFVEMDCKAKKGVPALKAALFRELERMPWVREPIPETWDAVRTALTEISRWKHMSDIQYRDLCVEHGVTDEGQQDYLTEIMHSLGIALHFRNASHPDEADILHPGWLIPHAYALLHRAGRQSGILTQADVDALLHAEKDEFTRSCVMRVLERFGIACALLSENGGIWLVRHALPDAPPAGVEDFRDTLDANHLRFIYQSMPDGLLTRFIERRHDFIEEVRAQKQLWNKGVIFTRKGARSMIRIEPEHRHLTITVIGPEKPRQQLTELCQAEMRDIHAATPGLTVVEETRVKDEWMATATLMQDAPPEEGAAIV